MSSLTVTTPKGHTAIFDVRDGTSDHNSVWSCTTEDEYGLRDLSLGAGIALDVGAHIGGVTVGLALDNPDATVIAIEALTANVELLAQNVNRNDCANVIVKHAAASKSGTKTATVRWNFSDDESGQHHRFIGNATNIGATGGDSEKVSAISLDTLVKEHGPITFVKIDCEGGEYAFLDTPAVKDVTEFRGEFHAGYAPLRDLLDATHHVYLTSGTDQFGGFRAVRK